MKIHYKFYATLLDAYAYYMKSESDDGFLKVLSKLNRVQHTTIDAQKGIALNSLVDEMAAGKVYPPRNKDGMYRYNGWEFPIEVIDYLVEVYQGAFTQHFTQGVLKTRKGNVQLYGFVDEILPGETHDIKAKGEYEYPSFLNHWQKVVYPYCLAQEGIHCPQFTYMITDYSQVYREDYLYDPDRDVPKLILICEELIDFIENHRDRIHDKKLFALDDHIRTQYVELTLDQYSAFKKKGASTNTLYGLKGEKVEVLSENGHVLIVKGIRGAFPVIRNETTT